MSKKVNLFASFKKEKIRQEKENAAVQSGAAMPGTVKIKMTSGRRLVVSFIISAIFFCICLMLIKSMSAEEEKTPVLVTVKELPENLKIAEGGAGYFTVMEIPVSLVPEGAVTDPAQIAGCFAACSIPKNQILSLSLFSDKLGTVPEIENPVEVSVGTNAIAQIVGGTIREGDLVNISTVKKNYTQTEQGIGKESYRAEPVVTKAYVTRTFTSAGVSVSSEDTTQPVTVINILIPAEEEAAFNAALEEGNLRISRICE